MVGDGALLLGLNDSTFAHVATAGFMQLAGIMMLPNFLGPTFNPIVDPAMWLGRIITATFPVESPPELEQQALSKTRTDISANDTEATAAGKKKRKRKKKMA